MREIYVDGSGRGNIGIVIVENGKVISLLSKEVKTKGIKEKSTLAEYVAILEGLKLAQEGDYVYTDQTHFIENLLTYGQINITKLGTKFLHRQVLNQVKNKVNGILFTKEGITIQDVESHKNNKFHNIADHLAKKEKYLLKRYQKKLDLPVERGTINLNKVLA